VWKEMKCGGEYVVDGCLGIENAEKNLDLVV
jgi:hypothetical protein